MDTPKSKHITWTDSHVDHAMRTARNHHRGAVVWFTGLSGAGKTTLALLTERELFERGVHSYVLDGDNVRHGLNRDLGFSPEDRTENIRRIGEVASLMRESGMICITAFISPYVTDREAARATCPEDAFLEVFCRCPLEECERRDTKGLYQKARAGIIPEFTGISAPYEEPLNPEIILDTDQLTPSECVQEVIRALEQRGILNAGGAD